MTDPLRPPARLDDESGDEDLIEPRVWRRWVIGVIAAVLVAIMVLGPVSRLIDRARPQYADNGLELCGFDYCTVQTAVRDAGYGPAMARLSSIRLDPGEAQRLADQLVELIDQAEVTVAVVDTLPGNTAGRYDAKARVVEVEEPIWAWVVVHEVAHTRAAGHGEAFEAALLALLAAIE